MKKKKSCMNLLLSITTECVVIAKYIDYETSAYLVQYATLLAMTFLFLFFFGGMYIIIHGFSLFWCCHS